MMSTYTITTFEQLCERLARADDENFTLSVDDIDPRALACHIRIEGESYGPRIPGYLLQALADLQTTTMRTYAFLAKGKEDLRGLQRDNLWTIVEVEEGSLKLKFSPKGIFFEISKDMFKDLTPNQKLLAMLLPPLAFIGFGVYWVQSGSESEITQANIKAQAEVEAERIRAQHAHELEMQREMNKHELEMKREINEHEREVLHDQTIQKAFEMLDALAKSNREFGRALEVANKNARAGVENIIQNAAGATKIDVGARTYSAEEIRKIQAPEALPPHRYPKEGEYLIVQINTEKAGAWKVLLKDTKTSEKVATSFDPEELFTSLERAKEIFDYQRDEKVIYVRFSVLERGTNVINSVDIFRPL